MVEILWFQDFQVGREDSFILCLLMGFSAHCLIICNSIIPREIKTHYEKWDSLRDVQTQKFSSYNNTTKVFRWVLDFVPVFQISQKTRQFQPHFWQSFVPEKVWYDMREINVNCTKKCFFSRSQEKWSYVTVVKKETKANVWLLVRA